MVIAVKFVISPENKARQAKGERDVAVVVAVAVAMAVAAQVTQRELVIIASGSNSLARLGRHPLRLPPAKYEQRLPYDVIETYSRISR